MSRTETVTLEGTPHGEDCAQVGEDGYGERARKECRAYANQLRRMIAAEGKTVPEDFRLVTKGHNGSDYGTYYGVEIRFPEEDEAAMDLAIWVDNNQPEHWDAEARAELGLPEPEISLSVSATERGLLVAALSALELAGEDANRIRAALLSKVEAAS